MLFLPAVGISAVVRSPSPFPLLLLIARNKGIISSRLLAVDEEGDTDSCSVTVTVQDALPPDAVCQDINLEIGLSGQVAITAQQVEWGKF
jgi:hypothetical protein